MARTFLLASLLRILALTQKELLAILKDPRSRVTLFLPPIVQCLIFGYAATYDLTDIPYAVIDRDHSEASTEFMSRLDGSGVFHRQANLQTEAEAERFINEREALLIVKIPADFQRKLESRTSAEIQVLADGRNSNTAGTASGYLSGIVEGFNVDWIAAHPGRASQAQTTVISRAWYNPNLETRWNMIPGMIGTLTLLQTLLLTAMSVAREREQGTFDQLLVTPFRPVEIMIGKALPSVLVGLTQASTILLVAQLWFHIPFAGSFLVLYLGLFLFLLAAVGIGLLVSSVSATMQQALLYSFVLLMPFSLLSGLTTPIRSMPEFMQFLTLFNPLRYAIDIVHRVYLEAAGINQLWRDFIPLMVLAAITLFAASRKFRNIQ